MGLAGSHQMGRINVSAVLRGEAVFLPFVAFRDCPHSLAHGPLPSSKPAVASQIFHTTRHFDTDSSASPVPLFCPPQLVTCGNFLPPEEREVDSEHPAVII